MLDDDASKGAGFLSDVAEVWERETQPAADCGVRVVNLRFGVVLSSRRGVVQKLYMPYLFGLGGPVGPGSQYMSWITLGDAVRAIEHSVQVREAACWRRRLSGSVHSEAHRVRGRRRGGRAAGPPPLATAASAVTALSTQASLKHLRPSVPNAPPPRRSVRSSRARSTRARRIPARRPSLRQHLGGRSDGLR